MRRVSEEARRAGRRNSYRIFVVKPEERNHLQELSAGGKIILNCIYRK
jgi:hypothetical protein